MFYILSSYVTNSTSYFSNLLKCNTLVPKLIKKSTNSLLSKKEKKKVWYLNSLGDKMSKWEGIIKNMSKF